MTGLVAVYGFGSAFGSVEAANDIDLLIIHCGDNPASCQFAITCKRRLTACTSRVHITMLSEAEEAYFEFIKTAKAVRLGTIRQAMFEEDITTLGSALPTWGAT